MIPAEARQVVDDLEAGLEAEAAHRGCPAESTTDAWVPDVTESGEPPD